MAQTIQIKRGTGSAIPSNLADGELAINLDSGQLYYGSGSASISHFRFKDITAETYTVSSSVTNLITQTSSGSTSFGNSGGDKHSFIGSMVVTGSITIDENNFISSSGDIISSQTITMQTASIGGGIFTSASLASAVAMDLSAYAQITNVVANSATASFLVPADTASFLVPTDTASFLVPTDTASFLTSIPAGTISASAQISTDISGAFNGQTSSFITNSQTGSFITNSQTASFIINSQTSSFLTIGSDATFDNITATGNITAKNYIISSSVTHITTQTLSGSTQFGDSSDDVHHFTGNISASGYISASGNILFNKISGGTF
jgi:hypothetical protein